MRWILIAVLAGCGAQPNQPVLANAPRPNPAAVAGGAAAAAAAITLASPPRGPEKKKESTDMKGKNVKENVPADVLDRADTQKAAGQPTKDPADPSKAPEQPKGALDFGSP
jgi:hypothetical protein